MAINGELGETNNSQAAGKRRDRFITFASGIVFGCALYHLLLEILSAVTEGRVPRRKEQRGSFRKLTPFKAESLLDILH